MERRLPRSASGQVRQLIAQRSRVKTILSGLKDAIEEAEAAAAVFTEDTASETSAAADPAIEVVIGTSAMAEAEPTLISSITQMINSAYFLGNKELLPPTATTYTRVDEEDVANRLEMGDAGARANRVLHLAYREGRLVGAMSSTFQPGWTPEGCGHWGLLVVDPSAQGSGVARALVAAAERRLAGSCQMVQIEYEYTQGHVHSEKLMEMYERRMGFQCSLPMPRRRRRGGNAIEDGDEQPTATQFRKCHKRLPERLCAQQRPQHLKGLKASFEAQLAAEAADKQPGGINRVGRELVLGGPLSALAHLRGRTCRVELFQPADEEEDEDGSMDPASYIACVQPVGGAGADERGGDDDDEHAGAFVQVEARFLVEKDEAVAEAEDEAVAEVAAEAPPPGADADGSAAAESSDTSPNEASAELAVGVVVRAKGLTGRADLNGQKGTIVAYHEDKARFAVLFESGESALLKSFNLDAVPLGAEPSEVQ